MKYKSKIVLCDIEGTTTAISFIKDCLFPYSKTNVRQYLTDNWNSPSLDAIIKELLNLPEYPGIIKDLQSSSIEDISKSVEFLVDCDSKAGPLKSLQGVIWKKGFENGLIKGHVFKDVPKAFKSWSENGLKLYIYSSGSIEAQKLLFQYSENGDLLQYLSGHFDTKIGNKKNASSYKNILEELNCKGSDVIFFTDIVEEAEAATENDIKSILLSRPGNLLVTDEDLEKYNAIKSFDDIEITKV